jgi:acetyl esterase/lipase
MEVIVMANGKRMAFRCSRILVGLAALTWLAFVLFAGAAHAVSMGEDRCDGDSGEWNLPYGCDLNQSYDDPFLTTDTRDTYEYYSNINSYDIHRLDVFYPRECLTTRDCRVFINVHGGAWKDYYKDMIDNPESQHASWFMSGRTGWIVVVPDYRLCNSRVYKADANCPDRDHCNKGAATQAAVYPDNVEDISAIVDWVWRNTHLYGARNSGLPEQTATDVWILGHSAGGHLVFDWATNPDFETERHKVRGVISLSGGYDILTLSPLLWDAVNDTFPNITWKTKGSPYHNITQEPSHPYPKLLAMDCDTNDLANLGAPQVVGEITYPDQAQEFVNKMQSLNYAVCTDVSLPGMDLWHVILPDYRHVDEYAATSYSAVTTDPAFFEPLYVQWEKAPQCEEESDRLGPRLGQCPHVVKPPAGSWVSPTDVLVQWMETLSAPILYVDNNGISCGGRSPCYTTIQKALEDACDGALLCLREGNYGETPEKHTGGSVAVSGSWDGSCDVQSAGTVTMKTLIVLRGSVTLKEVRLVLQP